MPLKNNNYSKDALVEQPAIKLFEELGWETANYLNEIFGPEGYLGRENGGELVLVSPMCHASAGM